MSQKKRAIKIKKQINEIDLAILSAFQSFKGMPHRMEFVGFVDKTVQGDLFSNEVDLCNLETSDLVRSDADICYESIVGVISTKSAIIDICDVSMSRDNKRSCKPQKKEIGKQKNNIYKISFYNDSKATNPEAASKSISSLKNIYLLAGGIAKVDNIIPIEPYIKNIKSVYLFGKDKYLLNELFGKHSLHCHIFENMRESFECAFGDANNSLENSVVLLAPLCASLDQFKNFEERGNIFKKMCYEKIAK